MDIVDRHVKREERALFRQALHLLGPHRLRELGAALRVRRGGTAGEAPATAPASAEPSEVTLPA